MTTISNQGGPEQELRPALRRCVSLDPDTFADRIWSRQPLLSSSDELRAAGRGDGFADLFSLDAVDDLLSRRGLRTPFLRIAKGGTVVPPASYTRSGGTGALIADQVSDDQVLRLFADGHTIVLQGLHRTWAPIADFAGQLARDLGHPVQVNAYVTPPQSQGFSAHYDVHDVFVLQVAGQKRWIIHEPVLREPLRDEPWADRKEEVAARATEEPVLRTVLGPGDALYLPRGYLHSAEALGEVSCHLTVGVHPVTRQAVLDEVVALLRDDAALRASLPLGVDVADSAAVAADVRATVDAIASRLSGISPDDVAARLGRRLLGSNRPAAVGPLSTLAAISRLTAGTLLAARPHQRVLVEEGTDGVRLRLADRVVDVPAAAEPALRRLLSGEEVAAGSLIDGDETASLDLARRLLTDAVLVTADLTGPPA